VKLEKVFPFVRMLLRAVSISWTLAISKPEISMSTRIQDVLDILMVDWTADRAKMSLTLL
jgi:hypothetical protein